MADFAGEYGIRLHGSGMRWPEFACLIAGLFGIDSRIRRRFMAPKPANRDAEEEG